MSEDSTPVTRTECRLRHENVEQRFGGLERDMSEMKRDMAEVRKDVSGMKATLTNLSSASTLTASNVNLILKVLVAVLLLVLAGRGLDVSSFLGAI